MKKINVSLPTAKQYKSEVMRKLGVKSLSELMNLSNQTV
jgi:DNA-binding CsgD family transcriptional regulator